MSEDVKRLRSLDFLMGLAFVAIGLYVCLDGVRIVNDPSLGALEPVARPGMTMIAVGGLLALMGLILALIGFKGSGNPVRIGGAALREWVRRPAFLKGLIVITVIAAYYFVLWRLVPYWVSTSLFLLALMFVFKAGKWWKILIIAGVTVALVVYFFGVLAQVMLP